MTERGNSTNQGPDMTQLAETIQGIADRSQKIVRNFMAGTKDSPVDPLNVNDAFVELTTRMMTDPTRLAEAQVNLWNGYMDLWKHAMDRLLGEDPDPLHEPGKQDRRFRQAAWSEELIFDHIKQSYLFTSRWLVDLVRNTDGLDEQTAHKVDFYTRQFVDAMAPTNFVLTNPTVIQATMESKGENLLKGLSNLLDDMERGRLRMVEEDAFTLGETVATTPGKVVYQNDLMQLIQYEPRTDEVRKRPLLIVPPWINKYYVLDLREENSFVRWAVDQGHTVFITSWINPGSDLAHKTFQDYMLEGPIAATEAALQATGADKVNLIGYCIGGTLTASALAWMAARGDERVASATFFATLVDFKEPGELGVFIDDEQVAHLEERMSRKGYLEGSDMATTFNMLRANDLIWSFVINNYLLGKEPMPLDLLFWNSDSTRMPASMHSYYLRNMYQRNALAEPGVLRLAGEPIDLGRITLPVYILGTSEDHIAPWKSTYAARHLYGGPTRFVLSSSGHIAGVINPPEAGRYSYRTNTRKPKSAETWLKNATEHRGSWWPDWDRWVRRFAGGKVSPRQPGVGSLSVIEDAPGSYVMVKADQDKGH